MRILILSGKFGMGHIRVAEAIKEQILKEYPNYEIKIVDFLEYTFPLLSKIIYKSFNFLANKCQMLYNLMNKLTSKKTSAPLKKIVVTKIEQLLDETKPDCILSVVPLCTQYISAYKRLKERKIVLHTCITDICVHEEWLSKETNMYYVPCKETQEYLIKKEIPKEKIKVIGIPVKKAFYCNQKKEKEHRVLIMGGGLGLLPNINPLLDFLEKEEKIKTTIIVGKNRKLFSKLFARYKNIDVVGFTNTVDEYLKKADIIITKAGGITLFESIATETPIMVMKPFLSQEVGNAMFIINKKIGEMLDSENYKKQIINILQNQKNLQYMQKNMRELKRSFVSLSTIFRTEGE